MSRLFLDPGTELSLLDEVAQRRQRLSALRGSIVPQVGQLAEAYADAYPWMDPTAVQSLVQAGVSPDLPQVQSLADLAAQEAAENGQLADPADDLADPWYETLWNVATGWAKPIVRTGFAVLATPIEEIDALLSAAGTALFDETKAGQFGLVSDLGPNLAALAGEVTDPGSLLSDFWTNYTQKAARSTGVLALADLVQGKHVDLGAGFLPAGEIFEEREAAKYRLTLDGHFVTPGRLMARQLTEPGTFQYQALSGLYDTAKQLFLDPSVVATAGLSKAAKANRAFQAVGAVWGTRKTVAPARAVQHYLSTELGRRTVRWLTDTTDVEPIWQALGRTDLGVANRLARSKTETETFSILSDVLGTVIREKPTAGFVSRGLGGIGHNEYGRLFGGGARARRSLENSRLARIAEDLPGRTVNVWDPNDAARSLDAWMKNAQLPLEMRRARIAELAEVTPGDGIGMFDTVRRVMDDAEGLLVSEWGIKPSRARRLTRLYEDLGDDMRTFDLDELGRHVDVLAPLRVNVAGEIVDVRPTPGLISELIDDIIPLPDPREIRRVTPAVHQLQRLYDSGLWKGTVDGLEAVMTTVWKPLQLLRGAYTVRVIGEEQLRMAGAGYDSLISHPASAIAWSLSVDPKSRLGQRLAHAASKVIDPKGTATVTGEAWDDIAEHAAALSRGSAGHRGLPGEVLTGRFVKARRGETGYYSGWATELAHEANDPVMRRVAGGLSEGDLRSIGREASPSTFDDVADWFWSGTGQKWRKTLGRMEGRSGLLKDRTAANEYLRQNYFARLERMTGGDPDLVELVATGKLGDGVNLKGFGHDRRLASLLEESYAPAAPAYVKRPETIVAPGAASRTAQRLDAATERAFEALMSRPTNWLSRSPTFRQKYWQRVEELVGSAPRAVQTEAIKAGRAAGIGGDTLARMAKTVLSGEGSVLASLDDIDVLAKSWALSETKRLLYDLSKRSQVFDVMRLVFPFGEAWKEIIGAWTRILRQNPQTLRRFQQALDGARSPSILPGAEPETTPESGRGFFAPDPNTGEEVFSFPAAWVGALLGVNDPVTGAGVSFVGRAAGLNIVSATVLPGFGPALQIPASYLIPRTPKYDDLRELLFPFGEEGVVESFMPAWLEKIVSAASGDADPDNNRLFANTVADVVRALNRSGKYDITTVAGQQRLVDDATRKAKALYLVRGVGQFFAPTAPAFTWTTTDVAGNVVPVKVLADELRRMTDEEYGGDRQAAFTEWVRRYGVDNVLAVVGKSSALVERPVTEKGDEWLRAHADLERTYPMTVGFFAPEPAVGTFDYNAYLRQFETGAREALSPAEQVALANDFLGRIQWEQAKTVAAFRPGPITSVWLASVREQLAEAHPGFDGWVSRRVWEQRPKTDEMIAELRTAVTNPALAATDTGQGVVEYLSAIDVANGMVALLPGNVRRYQQAKSASHIRDWLRSVARQIIEEHPDFARTWHTVFERELADDEGLAAAA